MNNLIYKLRHDLHSIPELSMQEYKTKAYLLDFLHSCEGLEVVDCGNWFYAYYNGRNSSENALPALAFRADFDAVAGKDGTPGHFCGHDGHAAVLAGFAKYISETRPERPAYLIFQPAEETGEGAALCRELLQDPEKNIAEIYGFHNIPGYTKGSILALPGTFACASTGLEIRISGYPSHAAYPEAGKNPSDVIAKMILMKDKLQENPYGGLTLATVIGVEIGSDSYGVSASEGVLRFTIRAEKEAAFQMIVNAFSKAAEELSTEAGMECRISRIEEFPATENHAACVEKLQEAAKRAGIAVITPKEPFRWSEDFGYYLQEVPGAFFGVGDGEEWPQLHTEEYEYPDEVSEAALSMFKEILKG